MRRFVAATVLALALVGGAAASSALADTDALNGRIAFESARGTGGNREVAASCCGQ